MTESAPNRASAAGFVPAGARLALARAAAQVLADEVGCRMLHIKGSAVDPRIQPVERHGSDVDVLADPRGIPRLHQHLLAHGWRVYSTFRFGSSFEHAQTYLHDEWGYLDLHRRFPGIGLDDQRAFDLLWAERTGRESAGIPYAAPSLDAQTVILVLNAARGRAPLPAAWLRCDEQERERLGGVVRRLDAEVAFAAAVGGLDRYRGRREYLLWKVTAQGGPRVAEWWGRVRAQHTIGGSLRVAVQAPVVNTDRLAHRLGRAPTRRQIFVEFFSRAGQAVRETGDLIMRSAGRKGR